MQSNYNATSIAEIKEVFDLFDLTGEGKITYSQCCNLMRVLGLRVITAVVLRLLGNPSKEEMSERTMDFEDFMVMFLAMAYITKTAFCQKSLGIHIFERQAIELELQQILCARGEQMTEEEMNHYLARAEDARSWAEYEDFLAMVRNN